MPFDVSWRTLLDACDELSEGATLITPLSHERFRITDVQEHCIITKFHSGESRPLHRDQFETLYGMITSMPDGFDLDRLPPDAEAYPAVLSLHPRFEVDEREGTITETDPETYTTTQLVDDEDAPESASDDAHTPERQEPDLSVYADALLLIDVLERHDVSDLGQLDTSALVNLYTLLSDVQRGANEYRQEVTDVLLDRLHHDRPVHGQYGSVQRTARRRRTLKHDEEVLSTLEDAGIERERVLAVDREKVDEVLDVTELAESDLYEIEQREYVRKAEVDEDVKETRLQGLKDRLAATESEGAEELRREIEALEQRIDDLTSFRSGREMA
ncbi:hypothetical protein [Natronorarus salvus]|uniref:hypothetical protein n=1 Tax=Natronorarus salvus TaxID=3117733 RepID=UPI002F26A1D0